MDLFENDNRQLELFSYLLYIDIYIIGYWNYIYTYVCIV